MILTAKNAILLFIVTMILVSAVSTAQQPAPAEQEPAIEANSLSDSAKA